MRKFFNRNKKIVIAGLMVSAVILVLPLPANALFGIDLSPISIMGTVFSGISYVFGLIFGLFFMLGGWLVNLTMGMNMNILGTDNTLVSVGWTICRDVANLGFVLIMILIAVTTIIHYDGGKYGTKLLPVMIGAAILVNFSLTISGVFINFSNTLSNTFFSNSFGSHMSITGLGDIVGGAFNPQRLLLKNNDNPPPPDPASQAGTGSTFSTAVLMMIAGLVFNVIFMAIATFSLFVLALMLLYRYVYLSIILVLAPIAFLFWAFPDLKSHFSDWWKNFIKWTFFLPAVTFFMYLAVKSAETLGKQTMVAGAGFDGSIQNIMSNGVQMILLAGLMLGGIIAAQQMGINGAGAAMKLAMGAKDGTLKYTKGLGRRIATRPLRSEFGKKVTDGMQTLGQNSAFGRILAAPLRYAGRGAAKVRMDQEKKAADAAKNLPKNLDEQARQYQTASSPRRVAILANITKERNARKKKSDEADRKVSAAQEDVTRLEKELSDAMKLGANVDPSKTAEIRDRLNKTKGNLEDAKKNAGEVGKSMEEINRVLNTLPKSTQQDLEESIENGKYEMKNIKMAQRYGYREGNVKAGEGKTEKVEAAIKAITEEGEEKEKKKESPDENKPSDGGK